MRLGSTAQFLLALVAAAQTYPPPFPREGARRLLENDRITLWEVVWPKGQPSPVHEHRFDQISVTLRGGSVRITKLDGTSTVNQSEIGSVTLTPRGTVHTEEGLSDTPQRKIMVELKPSRAPAVTVRQGVPNSFPREGAVKLMENDRVIAWDYTWKPGQPVPLHAEYHDSVSVFLEGGTLRTGSSVREFLAGQALYALPTAEPYAEEATSHALRAIVVELK